MEILEKLPGITVERHLLLHGSYTATKTDKMKNYENTSNVVTTQKQAREAIRNRYATSTGVTGATLDETQRGKHYRGLENRQMKGSFSVSSYHKYETKPDLKIELEVLGKNPRCRSQDNEMKSDLPLKQTSSISSDQSPPVLKSILKRTGSGVSSRSCTLIEVMSLDSGMCRLAASLAAHQSGKGNSSLHGKASSKNNAKPLHSSENKTAENTDLQHAKHSHTITSHLNENDSQKIADANPAVVSPTKSVSFKLDPEMQNREKERSLMTNRRGDARWGVVISSHQTRHAKERAKTPRHLDFSSSRRREIKSNASRFSTHELEREAEKKRVNEKPSENNLSIALLRHHALKGKPSMSELHQLSESYRKYLMSRALEQTPQAAKEVVSSKNTITLKAFLAEEAAGSKTKGVPKKHKNSGLDKQYMAIPNQPYSSKPPPYLPKVYQK